MPSVAYVAPSFSSALGGGGATAALAAGGVVAAALLAVNRGLEPGGSRTRNPYAKRGPMLAAAAPPQIRVVGRRVPGADRDAERAAANAGPRSLGAIFEANRDLFTLDWENLDKQKLKTLGPEAQVTFVKEWMMKRLGDIGRVEKAYQALIRLATEMAEIPAWQQNFVTQAQQFKRVGSAAPSPVFQPGSFTDMVDIAKTLHMGTEMAKAPSEEGLVDWSKLIESGEGGGNEYYTGKSESLRESQERANQQGEVAFPNR